MTIELDFQWHGGRPSLNFVATVGKWRTSAFDRTPEPADLARWFRDAGLVDVPIDVGPDDLAAARALRSSLWRLFSEAPSPMGPSSSSRAQDVAVVNQWTSVPVPGPRLDFVDGRGRLTPTVTDVRGLLALIARDAAELLGGPLAGRIRECAQDECTLLFVDESRAGSRRWCSMDGCGARSKMTAYRKRLTPGAANSAGAGNREGNP